MYYAKVTEIMPSASGGLKMLNDIVYGFNSYKWRDTFVREFNQLAQTEPYISSDVTSRASVEKRDVLRYGYEEIPHGVRGAVEYQPIGCVNIWAHRDTVRQYEGGWAVRAAPTVRVPAHVDYDFSGGYVRPRF